MSPVRIVALAVALLGTAPRARAQEAPPRPKLAASADTNDWAAYYDYGVSQLRRRADLAGDAFYWASQIDPSRAEPIYARWVAFWLADYTRWLQYANGRPVTLRSPEELAADSLPELALRRSPFVHQGLFVVLVEQAPGYWGNDHATRGMLAYAQANFQQAAQELGRAIERERKGKSFLRSTRAQCFVKLARYDSAAAELETLRAELDRRDQREVGHGYESKEIVAYSLALLHIARGDAEGGRAALGDALTENLGFYPAHDLLGQLALARGDTVMAVREAEQAAQIAPDDPVMQYHHGVALLGALRPADAVAPLRRATSAAPWYAAAHYSLGIAMSGAGDAAGARAALERYLSIAPRADSTYVAAARRELAKLPAVGEGR